jgi:Hfq protein
VLETNNQEQLIFKHAISTVAMGRATHGHGERSASVAASAGNAEAASAAPHSPTEMEG